MFDVTQHESILPTFHSRLFEVEVFGSSICTCPRQNISKSFSHIAAIMKFKRFFVKFLLIFWFTFASGKFQSSIVPYAIKSIIDEHFAKLSASHPGNVDIVCIGDETKEFLVLMDLLVKLKIVNVNIKIKKIKSSDKTCHNGKQLKLDESSILFFDSKDRFKDCSYNILWTPYLAERRQHLVYVPSLSTSDISAAFPKTNAFFIDQVSFLMNEDKNSIELVSGFMFTAQACRQLQLKLINRFDANAEKWENSIFYPKKYRNFHSCRFFTSRGSSSNKKHGELYDIIFGNILNAEVYHIAKTLDKCKECQLTLHTVLLDLGKYDYWITANPHVFITHNFVVPPGEPYSDLERMFMMFSADLWTAIGITLLIGILVTLSLNLVSAKVKKFIAGRDIQSPTMNLVSIFLTGGQVRTPGRNFARFLFTLFVIWSLIIRTCHQSMLFELMQADLRRPPIRTHDELFKSDLILHELRNYKRNGAVFNDEHFWQQMEKPSTRFA